MLHTVSVRDEYPSDHPTKNENQYEVLNATKHGYNEEW